MLPTALLTLCTLTKATRTARYNYRKQPIVFRVKISVVDRTPSPGPTKHFWLFFVRTEHSLFPHDSPQSVLSLCFFVSLLRTANTIWGFFCSVRSAFRNFLREPVCCSFHKLILRCTFLWRRVLLNFLAFTDGRPVDFSLTRMNLLYNRLRSRIYIVYYLVSLNLGFLESLIDLLYRWISTLS